VKSYYQLLEDMFVGFRAALVLPMTNLRGAYSLISARHCSDSHSRGSNSQ